MTVQEFREKVKAGKKLSVDGKDFLIKEVVKFKLMMAHFTLNAG